MIATLAVSSWRLMLWTCLALFGLALGPTRSLAEDASPRLPQVAPERVGMDSEHLRHIDTIVAEALGQKKMPGCVVCIGRSGRIALLKAYGDRQLEPSPLAMTTDTVFDLASITKPIATATSVMVLVERGRVRLTDPVATYLPDFAQNGKDRVTCLQLLTHQSGLTPDNPLADYEQGPEEAIRRALALPLESPPGAEFKYSDVGFIILGELIRTVTGQTVHEFSRQNIFVPLGMHETTFLPDEELAQRAAPTERRGDVWVQGTVHDPRAHLLGGVAGHAGLFSTAEDLAIYAQMMLGEGRFHEVRLMSPRTVARMAQAVTIGSETRGLGWDKQSRYGLNRGELFSERAFGHGGFTGTVLWIDPELELFVIFLSNRVHPDGRGLVNPLAGRIGSIAAAAILGRVPESEPAAVNSN